jgi:hypothetical protein
MSTAVSNPTFPDRPEQYACDLAERIRPMLAGEHPAIVGAVLAQLVAVHIAGHKVPSFLRAHLLRLHSDAAWKLVPIADAELDARRDN